MLCSLCIFAGLQRVETFRAYPTAALAAATPDLRAQRAARSMVGIPLAGTLGWDRALSP